VPPILAFLLPIPFLPAWNDWIGRYGPMVAAVLFLAAALTDTLDGRIARTRGLVTNLGRFLDPIADKILVLSAMTAFVQRGRLSAWIVILVTVREFVVSGIRMLASDKGTVVSANALGKAKTVLQVIAVMMLMAEAFPWPFPVPSWPSDLMVAASLVMTLLSGLVYVLDHRSMLKAE